MQAQNSCSCISASKNNKKDKFPPIPQRVKKKPESPRVIDLTINAQTDSVVHMHDKTKEDILTKKELNVEEAPTEQEVKEKEPTHFSEDTTKSDEEAVSQNDHTEKDKKYIEIPVEKPSDKNKIKSFEEPTSSVTDIYDLNHFHMELKKNHKDLSKLLISERVKNRRSLRWSILSEVILSDIKRLIIRKERHLQEIFTEVITSEVKYLAGLDVAINHFSKSYLFSPPNDKVGYINPIDKHHIFSNIQEIRQASQSLLNDFETRWKRDRPFISDVCDIIYEHANSKSFKQYVIYIRNQPRQTETLKRLKNSQMFKKELKRIQAFNASKGLDIDAYLLLPLQRLTRLKLLCDSILRILTDNDMKTETYSTQIQNAQKCIKTLDMLLKASSKGNVEIDNKALLLDLLNKIDFPNTCKELTLNQRILIKEGEYLVVDYSDKPHRIKPKPIYYNLFLFNDIMLIGKRNGSRIQILDYCSRKDIVFTTSLQYFPLKKNIFGDSEDQEDLDEIKKLYFILKFDSSCNGFMKNPIIFKVEQRREIDTLMKYIPDCYEPDNFDYNRSSNITYWRNLHNNLK